MEEGLDAQNSSSNLTSADATFAAKRVVLSWWRGARMRLKGRQCYFVLLIEMRNEYVLACDQRPAFFRPREHAPKHEYL